MFARSVLILLLLASPAQTFAQPAPNAATDWAAIVQPAMFNADQRSAGTAQILHTMVMLAVYDATVAIEGGYEPYAAHVQAAPGASVRAAVAAAAYFTARERAPMSQYAYLDAQYEAYLATIPDGQAKADGIQVGQEAADAMIMLRGDDGLQNVVSYFCSSTPPPVGEFEPDSGCPALPADAQPADAKIGQVSPFTYNDPSRFRPSGPNPLTSDAYAVDFAETRTYGRADSSVRSPEQTDIAYFWSANPYVHWNQNLIRLAIARGLSVRDAARFFAMVQTSVSDAIVAGFEAKYHYRAWRPRTAIPQADSDGNPYTEKDATWAPLLKVNHPEYPSGHAFWSTALTDAVAAFFGTNKVTWTLLVPKTAVPNVVKTERTYRDVNALMREIDDARVWGGLHWRHTMRHGAQVGRKVTQHVTGNFFRPIR
jgi:PAP2 superfamily